MSVRGFVMPAILASFGLAACGALAQEAASAYTKIDSRRCSHKIGADVEDYGEWRCRGYAGIGVWLSAGDQRMYVSFGPRAAKEIAASETLAPFNDFYEGVIEWRLENRKKARPFATIARWNVKRPADLEKRTTSGSILVVTRLAPGGVCHVGYVDALANTNANELAREIADKHARSFECGKDRPVILGKVEPGLDFIYPANR